MTEQTAIQVNDSGIIAANGRFYHLLEFDKPCLSHRIYVLFDVDRQEDLLEFLAAVNQPEEKIGKQRVRLCDSFQVSRDDDGTEFASRLRNMIEAHRDDGSVKAAQARVQQAKRKSLLMKVAATAMSVPAFALGKAMQVITALRAGRIALALAAIGAIGGCFAAVAGAIAPMVGLGHYIGLVKLGAFVLAVPTTKQLILMGGMEVIYEAGKRLIGIPAKLWKRGNEIVREAKTQESLLESNTIRFSNMMEDIPVNGLRSIPREKLEQAVKGALPDKAAIGSNVESIAKAGRRFAKLGKSGTEIVPSANNARAVVNEAPGKRFKDRYAQLERFYEERTLDSLQRLNASRAKEIEH